MKFMGARYCQKRRRTEKWMHSNALADPGTVGGPTPQFLGNLLPATAARGWRFNVSDILDLLSGVFYL